MSTTPYPPTKFRPYFSPAELAEIIRCVKASSTNHHLLGYLEAFAIKIDRGVINHQLTLNPSPSLEQKLGIASTTMPCMPGPTAPSVEELFSIWKSNPEFLNPPQLSAVHQYRWENGLMSAEDAAAFEASIFGF